MRKLSSSHLTRACAALVALGGCNPPAAAPPQAPRPAATSSGVSPTAASQALAPFANHPVPPASTGPGWLTGAAARLAYVDQQHRVWLVGFDETAHVVGRLELATIDDPMAASRLTWSGDGRYLAWREVDRAEGKHRLLVYDLRANEHWSVAPWRSYLFMGPANHGFVFYDHGPAYFEPRTETGAHNEQAPKPRAVRPPLPAHDLHDAPTEPNPLASWQDRVFVAVSAGYTSMYGGPQQLYVVGLRGDSVRVADDTPDDDAVSNLPMSSLVPDTSGDFIAYLGGATSGREGQDYDGDYWILRIRETHTWRSVAIHDAGCWERKDLSNGRCRATPSWLAPLGKGAFAFIKSKAGEAAPVLRAKPAGLTQLGVDATSAMGNDLGMLLWLAPAPTPGEGSLLSVKGEGDARLVADRVATALWAPPLAPDDSALRREVASRFAQEDQDYGDPLRGVGWSNRCFAHIRAKRLEAARAACEMGLLLQPNADTAGALEYNLALVEDRLDRRPEACARLARSLAVRPSNGITAATAKRWKCGG